MMTRQSCVDVSWVIHHPFKPGRTWNIFNLVDNFIGLYEVKSQSLSDTWVLWGEKESGEGWAWLTALLRPELCPQQPSSWQQFAWAWDHICPAQDCRLRFHNPHMLVMPELKLLMIEEQCPLEPVQLWIHYPKPSVFLPSLEIIICPDITRLL